MPPPDDRLVARLGPGAPPSGGPAWTYAVAGQRVRTDRPVPQLGPWQATSRDASPPALSPTEVSQPTAADDPPDRLIHSGLGLVAGAWREVTCARSARGYRLAIGDVGTFALSVSGSPIALLATAPGAAVRAVDEAFLGPVLILALALRGTWCLHAGAVALDAGGAAIVGESGNGKSSLAAFLARDGGLLADDTLPVTLAPDGLTAWPRFPQLKLPPERQTPDLIPERAPLRAVYVLQPPEPTADDDGGIAIHPLSRAQATLALVRHTVAARLFDEPLMARHLAFCAAAAGRVAVRRLRYPRRWDVLPVVTDRIASDLASLRERLLVDGPRSEQREEAVDDPP